MRGNRQVGLFVLLSLFAGVGCSHQQTATTPPPRSTSLRPITPDWVSEVLSFSETHPVTSLVSLRQAIYAGTPAGLIRFDRASREFVRLGRAQGLPGDQIFGLAADPISGLWVATEGGISRFHDGVWTNIAAGQGAPPRPSAMVALGDGLWVGDSRGLRRYRQEAWERLLPGARVTTLLPDLGRQGIWVGTEGEGIYQLLGGKLQPHSSVQGQVLRKVARMSFADSGALLAVGESDQGPRLTFYDGRYWTTYTPDPPGRLHWVKQAGDQLLLAYQDRVLILERVPPGAGKEVPPEGAIGLIPSRSPKAPKDYPLVRFVTRPVDHWFPPSPTVVTEGQQQVLVGTRYKGAAAYDGKTVTWYRTRDLVGAAEKLKLACQDQVCFLAGGRGQGYRFQKAAFQAVQVDQDPAARVLAFSKSPAGELLALVGLGDGRTLGINIRQGGRWSRRSTVAVTAPGMIDVRFVRHAPGGQLWIGLSYLDNKSDVRPWGLMVLEPGGGAPLYHRDTMLPTEDRQPGSLALPDDVRDVAFIGDELWLSSTTGVCRVKGSTVDIFTENDNLASELVYKIVRAPGGEVTVATLAGLGRLRDGQWLFERSGPLAGPTRALLVQGGTLWVGTERGLVRLENGEMKLLDLRHGLAGDAVLDLFLEDDKRLWVLTEQGLSIVTL